MNSRERVIQAMNHQQPDRVPLDLGASSTSGMHVSSVYLLRQALKLDRPDEPVKVIEPYQMLGEIKTDLLEAVGADIVGVQPRKNMFGFENKGWKPWTLHDGTPVLVPDAFNTEPEPDGSLLMYPEGDRHALPSGKMPQGGWYFDAIIRQQPIVEEQLDPRDNLEEFELISDEDLAYFRNVVTQLYDGTDKAILATFGGTAFGDIALVPAPWMKNPRGIRDVEEWYVSTVARRDYVYAVFEKQCDIALQNLIRIFNIVGNRIHAVFLSGTDFGTQQGPFISPKAYRDLYKPFHKCLNDWIHQHTQWKCFIHSCGSISSFLPDMIEAGFDIFNPVQTSADGMDPRALKTNFGSQITFWGGGIDTQHRLPFGTPEEIRAEVKERMQVFGEGGGFIFNPIHNVQACIPVENILALYEAVQTYR